MRAHYGNAAVVVTAGERGCAVATEGFERSVPAMTVDVLDTTGAGDAFLGGMLAGSRLGLGWEATAKLANACGAACCEQLGAFPEDRSRATARIAELYGAPWPERPT